MSTKHTPGPWEATRVQAEGKCAEVHITHDHPSGFPDMICRYSIGHNSGRSSAANACLIAAAPELLEACKEALKNYSPIAGWSFGNDTAEIIQKAIANAEGE